MSICHVLCVINESMAACFGQCQPVFTLFQTLHFNALGVTHIIHSYFGLIQNNELKGSVSVKSKIFTFSISVKNCLLSQNFFFFV
jgi:hypothetical protein